MDDIWTPVLQDRLRRTAISLGFDLMGVAPALCSDDQEGQVTAERFSAWVDAGRAGEMHYLKRRNEAGELLRRSVRIPLPWARSIIVCAMNYNSAGPKSLDPARANAGWIARYAWSGNEAGEPLDYHDDLLLRLRKLEDALQEAAACQTRCYVDTGPLLERDLAAKAGIGWVGKNTCVLNQDLGSWLLLGVIVTSLPVGGLEMSLAADRCGSCTRCIDACPTDALVGPREMDASRCIAYLTIEQKGVIATELREGMGRQVFGCDICQEVCPWNRRAPIAEKEGLQTRQELVNPTLGWLAAMNSEDFRERFRGSPLERTKLKRIRRNVAIAMGNSGDEGFRAQLEEWEAGEEDEVLAEASGWALERLAKR